MFRTELSLTVVSEIATIATDEYILRQAFDSLFRGLHSAFRTTAFELSQGPRVAARDQEPLLVLALKEPAPDNFARATDLVRINVAMSRHRRMDAAILLPQVISPSLPVGRRRQWKFRDISSSAREASRSPWSESRPRRLRLSPSIWLVTSGQTFTGQLTR